jgi:hypothetical protein
MLFCFWICLVMSWHPAPAGHTHSVTFATVDYQNRTQIPCTINTTMYKVVQLFTVMSN